MSSFNNSSIPNETVDYGVEIEQYEESKGLHIFRLALFSVIILASVIGNSMVCFAVWSIPSRKPLSYYLIANMAFAEILSSVCLPVMLANWEDPNVAVRANCIMNPLQVLAILVVTYSLSAIAFYRYRVMVEPISRGLSTEIKLLTILVIWLVSLAICLPVFIGHKFEDGQCNELHVSDNAVYVLIKFILNYAVPYIIMLASYGAVAWNLRKRIVEVEKTIQSRVSMIPSSCIVEAKDQMELQDLAMKADDLTPFRENSQRKALVDERSRRVSKPENTDLERDLLRMIFVLIIVFVVCYFPYQVMFLWSRIYNINAWQFRYHELLQKYVFILICLPSALHPLCYGTMSSFYAKAFSKIILCRK